MSNPLVEVPTESLPILSDAYKVNYPEHVVAFLFLDKIIKKFKKHPEHRENVKIYCIDGKIEEDATFIAVTLDRVVIVATLDLTFRKLSRGLKGLNYNTEKIFPSLKRIHQETLFDVIKSEGLEVLVDKNSLTFVKTLEDIKSYGNVVVPEGLGLRKIDQSDVEKINSAWTHRFEGSDKFFSYCIATNYSLGLYDKNSGELIAWCFENDYSIFGLNVDEKHLRKGYAALLLLALAKLVVEERGTDLTGNIITTNDKSLTFATDRMRINGIDNCSHISVIKPQAKL